MKFYTLQDLHLPHIKAAQGVLVGHNGLYFVVLFVDDLGETIGLLNFYSPIGEEPWRYLKKQYIDICRRLTKKPWKTPQSVDSLYLYVCDVLNDRATTV